MARVINSKRGTNVKKEDAVVVEKAVKTSISRTVDPDRKERPSKKG